MLKKLFCALAILALMFSVDAASKKKSEKETKTTRKEQKAAKKNKNKKKIAGPQAIPGLPPAASNWKKGPNTTWEVNFNDAAVKAKQQGKKLFVLSSGSDWCPPCIKLKTQVLGSGKFRKLASENFVLVFIDSPRSIKLPATQVKHNAMVRKAFQFGGGVPSAVIIDPASMKQLGTITGYSGKVKDYIKRVERYAK